MTLRALRVFISARSGAGLIEEVEAARQAVAEAGGEIVHVETTTPPQENRLNSVRKRLEEADVVVFLFDNQTSNSVIEEIETVQRLGLPMMGFLKNDPGPAAEAKWLLSINLIGFNNTDELKRRLIDYLVELRASPLEVKSPNDEVAHAASPPPTTGASSTNQDSLFDLLSDSQTIEILRTVGFLLMCFMLINSYQWWSRFSIEDLVAQTPIAADPSQEEQRTISASFGPVDYRNPFNDLLREVPTTSGSVPGPVLAIVRSGTYSVGTDPKRLEVLVGQVKFESDEQPARQVNVARPFAIGMHEIVVAQYTLFAFATGRSLPLGAPAIIDENSPVQSFVDRIPSDGRDSYPVQNVSWDDATAYVNWLSSVTGARYRLPTEAEWELAARIHAPGGPESYWGWTPQNDIRLRCGTINIHWAENSDNCAGWNGPVPVADEYLDTVANMLGNVAEWTEDCYRPNYNEAPTDGSAVSDSNCTERVFRGGWWRSAVQFARPAFRAHAPSGFRDYSIGFRVVRELSDAEIAKLIDGPAQPAQEGPKQPIDDESTYPGVVVPDVMGSDEKTAIGRLTEAGFDPRPLYKNVRDDSPAPVVVSQSPEAGARVEYGATIDLVLTPPPRANPPNATPRQQPADTPSLRRPREFPPTREEQTSNDYEANPPQQQKQVVLPQESPLQQQQPPATSGKDPDASDVGKGPPKQR